MPARLSDQIFSGTGGTLTLTPDGVLFGAGWDLTLPYGVDYDPAAALAAPSVKIAEGVISAAAGYNYGLYVTADGTLHFIGSSGLPFAERFAFDGRIREIFAAADRDVFSLTDEAGDIYVWGLNLSGELQPLELVPRAVLDDQRIVRRMGKAVWRYRQNGQEHRQKGMLAEHQAWELRAELRRRVSEDERYRVLSAACGEDNLLLKYVKRSASPKREVCSPNWSEEDFARTEGEEGCVFPRAPGMRELRLEAWCGTEEELNYSVGIYTTNRVLYRPVKARQGLSEAGR